MKKNVNFNINAGILGIIVGTGMASAAGAGFAGGLIFSKKLHHVDAPTSDVDIECEFEEEEDDIE